MSRFGMGYGKDPPKDIQGTRPAVRLHSAKRQEMLNKWFTEKGANASDRPDWLQSRHKPKKRVGGPDLGEWKLVWHPRERMDSPTMPARKTLMTLKDDEEREKLKKILTNGLFGPSSARSEPAAARPQLGKDDVRAASARGGKRLSTAGSAKSRAGGGARDVEAGEGESRVSTAGSRRSRSALSVSSTVTRSSSVLIDRIRGLEEALKQEQQLRQKMQSLIQLEAWAE